MICKSCGTTIPSHLLRQDSFTCPNCGRAYRRSSPHTRNTSAGKSENPAPVKRRVSGSAQSSRDLPGWLVPAIAGVACLALVLCIVLLVRGGAGSAFKVCGTIEAGKIGAGKSVTETIEIPRQPNTQYIIATESSTSGILTSIKNKTEASFDLVIRNDTEKSRTASMTWVLIPCKLPAQKADSDAQAPAEAQPQS